MVKSELLSPQRLSQENRSMPSLDVIPKEEYVQNVQEHVCHFCLKVFKAKQYLERHIVAVHKKVKNVCCSLCGAPFYSQKELTRHMVCHTNVRSFHCQQCEKSFKTKRHLLSHEVVHTGKRDFKCDKCDRTFYRSAVLKSHMYIHTNEKPYKCCFCEFACRDKSTLRKHEARHTSTETAYSCKVCSHRCKNKWRLKLHVAEKHLLLDVRKYECDHCGNKFKTKTNLSLHIKRLHYKERNYYCSVCCRSFNAKFQMEMHKRRHYDARPFHCDHCERTFKVKCDLERHAVIHHKEKQHPCPICGRLFPRKHRIKSHILKVHEKAKRTPCPSCPLRFYSESYLRRHMSTHHADRPMVHCDYCNFGVPNKPGLISHIKQMHLQKEILRCDTCGKEYLSAHQLKQHQSREHGVARIHNTNGKVNNLPNITEVKAGNLLEGSFIDDSSRTMIRDNVKDLKRVSEHVFNKYIHSDGMSEHPAPIIVRPTDKVISRKRPATKATSARERDANVDENTLERERKIPKRNIKHVNYTDKLEMKTITSTSLRGPMDTNGKHKVQQTKAMQAPSNDAEAADGKDTHLEKLMQMHREAKETGRKATFPCNKCDKVCVALCGIKSHLRTHDRQKQSTAKGGITKKPAKQGSHKRGDDHPLRMFYEKSIRSYNITFDQFLQIYDVLKERLKTSR